MAAFRLDASPDLFVVAPTPKFLWVWELKAPHSSGVEAKNWECRQCIVPNDHPDYDYEYTSLEIHGVKIEGASLKQLAQDLYSSHLIVNYQGYSYLDTVMVVDVDYFPQYYRLNDLFNWSKYSPEIDHRKISLSITSATITTVNWDRCDFQNGELVLVSVKHVYAEEESEKKHALATELKETKERLRTKEERIAELEAKLKCCEDYGSSCGLIAEELSISDLKKRVTSLTADLEAKEVRLSILEGKVHSKEAELEELKRSVSSLTEHLKKSEEIITLKDKEVTELKERLEAVKRENEQLKRELKKCKLEKVLNMENPGEVARKTREGVGQDCFYLEGTPQDHTVDLSSLKGATLRVFMPMEEHILSADPDTILVYHVGNKEFDNFNWCYHKLMDKDDGEDSMIVYYEGEHSSPTFKAHGVNVRLPFEIGDEFSSDREFLLVKIEGIGVRFGFLYQ